ncbi:uncharacterized protein LOC123807687 [Phyllostomus hastatus]|uniref:uncharacterized protein LOC123807687 n=1 Tax=Phyllostomus hastatus TaxID=9423 RepID=UPI001E680C53|nr:uncharacterized protein LOC123807687 [Phyllostomus hastatus]
MSCTSPDKTHSSPTPEKLEAAERVTPKITLHPQASEPPEATSQGPEGMTHPVRKTLIPPILGQESKTSETKEREKLVQPKDSQRTKQLPCSSDFCDGRGICTMEGELRKCSCLVENNGEVCEEAARGPALSYITLGSTIGLSVVLVALGAFVHFRKDRKLKRNTTASSRTLASHKEDDQEGENLMNTETFVNEAYDEQVLLTSVQTD